MCETATDSVKISGLNVDTAPNTENRSTVSHRLQIMHNRVICLILNAYIWGYIYFSS